MRDLLQEFLYVIVGAPFELEHRLRMFGFEQLAEVFDRDALSIDPVFTVCWFRHQFGQCLQIDFWRILAI